ncbi:MAG: hypothetical protein EP343_00590 [Deltaproteobacteria bacterium]|nr:MAG: hypothetical protein EP343_00590 [Deltaproteobacteria bacterium]
MNNFFRDKNKPSFLGSCRKVAASITVLFGLFWFGSSAWALQPKLYPPSMLLGRGLHPQKLKAVGLCMQSCLNQQPAHGKAYCEYINMNEASLTFSVRASQNRLKKFLNATMNIHVRGGTTEFKGDVGYTNDAMSDAFSIVYTYEVFLHLGRIHLHNPQWKGVYGEMYKGGRYKALKKACGDSFVQEIVKGAKLFVSLRISFASKKQKKDFQAKVGVRASLTSVKLALKSQKHRFSLNTKVRISAHQIGGDVTKLPTIFGQDSDMVECTFGNLDNCKKALTQAIKYARGSFVRGLKDKNKHAIIGYSTSTYEESGYPKIKLPIPKILERNRARIQALATKVFHLLRTVQRLLDGTTPIRLSRRQRRELQAYETRVGGLLTKLVGVARGCNREPLLKCGVSATQQLLTISKQLRSLPADVLDIEPETLSQWWDFAQYSDDPSLKVIMNRLKVLAVSVLTKGALQRSGDAGELIERVLLRKRGGVYDFRSLNLSIPNAKYLARVAFSKLTPDEKKRWRNVQSFVKHHSQRVVDLRPLSSLVFLKRLNLQGNNVANLLPLMQMKSLRWINLRGNPKLRRLEPLKRLQLKTVLLDPKQRVCPRGIKNRAVSYFRPIKLSCGNFHCCALSRNGRIQCWGFRALGIDRPRYSRELEIVLSNLKRLFPAGTERDSCIETNRLILDTSTPFLLDLKNVVELTSGTRHTCALKKDQTVHCWGRNNEGQLGRPGRVWRPVAFPVLARTGHSTASLLKGVVKLEARGDTTCALKQNGQLWCWGVVNQLKSFSEQPVAVQILTIKQSVLAMAIGSWGVCSITELHPKEKKGDKSRERALQCSSFAHKKENRLIIPGKPVKLKLSGSQVCVLSEDGQLFCWMSKVGPKSLNIQSRKEMNTGSRLKDFSLGRHHICSLSLGGQVECWGNNSHRQLGIKTRNPQTSPSTVPGVLKGIQITSQGNQTCVLTLNKMNKKQVKCWGRENLYSLPYPKLKGQDQYVPLAIGLWQP